MIIDQLRTNLYITVMVMSTSCTTIVNHNETHLSKVGKSQPILRKENTLETSSSTRKPTLISLRRLKCTDVYVRNAEDEMNQCSEAKSNNNNYRNST